MSLTLAISPCPNDTFIFEGVVDGSCNPLSMGTPRTEFHDIQRLNEGAANDKWDIVKVSAAAAAKLLGKYRLLRCGGAMGFGCGPLLLGSPGRQGFDPDRPVWLPGQDTTASLIFRHWFSTQFPGRAMDARFLRFDKIYQGLQKGDVEQGVVIHEHRFTWQRDGLECFVDLGSHWESSTGLPIPLGVILCRKAISEEISVAVETGIRSSLRKAWDRPMLVTSFIRGLAQIEDDAVIESHIRMFVNDFSMDIGENGLKAVEALSHTAAGY